MNRQPDREFVQTPSSSAILDQLDREQRAAAEFVDGPLLIVAGPGSGKTRTLTHRIAHLVADDGIPPEACLAITFTRRAAAELGERFATLIPDGASRVPVHTFHSLGLSILRDHANSAGLQRGFRIADDSERAAALVETLDVSERRARSLLKSISLAKRTQSPAEGETVAAIEAYQRSLAMRNWVDFDDLVGLPGALLSSDPGLAAHYCDRFRFLSVDEFQDVDQQQYRLIKLLAPAGANLCVIGDANQAIYGFRGADAACFQRFQDDYPGTTVRRLTRNYRSSGTIITASGQVIAPDHHAGEVVPFDRGMVERITIHTAPTEAAEAEFVVQSIEQVIGGHSFFSIDSGRAADAEMANLSFADFAVLYRADSQSTALCEALARSGMPFKKHAHDLLVDRPGVQPLIQALDREAQAGALRDQLRSSADRLLAGDQAHDATVIEAALQQLLAFAGACGDDRERFLDGVPLASESDGWDPRADRVSLLTLHAAKGLEFPVVFIVGLEDGLLPLRWGADSEAVIEEERRLFYVGMTRAKDRLFLSRSVERRWRGTIRKLDPSPYLNDIETELLSQSRTGPGRKKAARSQLELF